MGGWLRRAHTRSCSTVSRAYRDVLAAMEDADDEERAELAVRSGTSTVLMPVSMMESTLVPELRWGVTDVRNGGDLRRGQARRRRSQEGAAPHGRMAKPFRRTVAAALAFSAVVDAGVVLGPVILGWAIDNGITPPGDTEVLRNAVIFYLLLTVTATSSPASSTS